MSLDLPTCTVQYPTCGACHGETTHNGDGLECEPCGLYYGDGEDGTQAEYMDEEADPCSKPCDNHWHGLGRIRDGYGYHCGTCQLPEGHTSDCYTNCKIYRIEEAN